MNRRGLIAGLALSACGVLTGCSEWFPVRYRYRVTVDVETPSGLRSGSSVMEASTAKNSIQIGDTGGHRYRLKGQAVIVDLPSGATIFALIDHDLPIWIRNNFLGVRNLEGDLSNYSRLGSRAMRNRSLELPRDELPKLAYFANLNDPQTAQQVDPDDVAAALGFKGRISRVLVTLTDEPITRGIEGKLPWLSDQRGTLLPPIKGVPIGERPFAGRITARDFWQGLSNG